MPGTTLGWKAWLFAGADRGGERAAVMYIVDARLVVRWALMDNLTLLKQIGAVETWAFAFRVTQR